MITKVKTSRLQESVPVTNNAKILNWIVDKQMDDYKNNHKSLMANLVDELTKAFGQHNLSRVFEFRTKIWVLQYKDLVFNVFSAPRKGTTIEVVGMSYEDMYKRERENDIISFLEELSKSY